LCSFGIRDRLTSSGPDAILATPLNMVNSIKSKASTTPHLQHANSYGELRKTHELKANQREVHVIEVEYCEENQVWKPAGGLSQTTQDPAGT